MLTGYNLLIICSSEYSTKSHLVTALHSYRRSNPVIDTKVLRKYLQNHLINPSYKNIGSSNNAYKNVASSVDSQKYIFYFYNNSSIAFYRSYVRIVYSKSSGNGKSLYIKRLGEALTNNTDETEPILTIPIHGPNINNDIILEKLCHLNSTNCKLIHFDIANVV